MAVYGNRRDESKGDSGRTWRTLMLIYMVFLWLAGLGCLAIGLWMNTDPYVKSYFTILRRSATDRTLYSVAALLLSVGFLVVMLGIIGCCGFIKRSRPLIGGFIAIMVIIMVMELTVGFLVVVFNDDLHRTIKQGMRDSITEGYEFDNNLGHGWNFVQVREKCCGVDEGYDYKDSNWFVDVNQGITDHDTQYVPITCCVLQFDQDRDPSRVDPQDPRPRDKQRCQDAAHARRGDDFLHERGCFATLLDFIDMHLNTLIGLGLATGLFQIVGLMLSCIYYRTMDTREL